MCGVGTLFVCVGDTSLKWRYLGANKTLERRGDRDSALALFDEAIRLSPDNALARYRRAKILIAMKKYQVRFFSSDLPASWDATDLRLYVRLHSSLLKRWNH